MDNKVKEHIDDLCVRRKWQSCNTPLEYIEMLRCNGIDRREVTRDEHRWYTIITRVVELDGMLIQFDDLVSKTEDATIADMDMEYDMDKVFEVEPYEKTITWYRRKA